MSDGCSSDLADRPAGRDRRRGTVAGRGRRCALHERSGAEAPAMTLRPATAGDADAVIAVWAACDLTRPWNDPRADFARALDHGASTIWVAESDADIVGTVMAGFDGHRGWIYYLGDRKSTRLNSSH